MNKVVYCGSSGETWSLRRVRLLSSHLVPGSANIYNLKHISSFFS